MPDPHGPQASALRQRDIGVARHTSDRSGPGSARRFCSALRNDHCDDHLSIGAARPASDRADSELGTHGMVPADSGFEVPSGAQSCKGATRAAAKQRDREAASNFVPGAKRGPGEFTKGTGTEIMPEWPC